MKKFRLLSGFLAVITLLSAFMVFPASAAAAKTEEEVEETKATIDYMNLVIKTPQEKLDTMTKYLDSEDGRYSLYVDPYSAEVAYHDNLLNQTEFTNPYNINDVSKSSSKDIKAKLLSQVIVKYLDNEKECYYYSYTEAAEREQIKVKNIKNGVRVEYSIGREETRKLVPKMISKKRFEEEIICNMVGNDFVMKKMNAFYSLKDPDDPTLTDRGVKEMQATFKITNKFAVYVFDPYATDRELNLIESYIIEFCPRYNYDELDRDHAECEYEGSDAAPAQFKMALEYYLEGNSLRVRFPVNGLRFDDTTYQLTSIEILPYFGCGSYSYNGYLFLPDGSGTLVRFEDFKALSGKTVTGKVYGQDYAFYEISGEHQESVRLPMYGVVENYALVQNQIVEVHQPPHFNDLGIWVEDKVDLVVQRNKTFEDKGFFAVIEEGEAIASISTETGGRTCNFDNVKTTITPRQRDTYDIAEAISGAGSAQWTVVSKRKYTGNYTIRYTMLNYDKFAEEKGLSADEYYPTTYMGMVRVARDYMQEKGLITRLTKDDVKDDIPLYIETFGTAETQEKILSFPINVQTPLTTFDDLKTMTEKLNENGITNLNYKLTAYFNGGLWYSVPYKVEVEKNAGGEEGFRDFVSYAKGKGIGVYPDFDFVWADAAENDIFSGLKKRQHLVKSMNTKYARFREYDPQYQEYMRTYYLAISPAYFSYYYDEFTKNFSVLDPIGISVASLGEYLNSDFDKKDPYNREDDKNYTVEIFQRAKDEYGSVMTEAGNYYCLPYVTHILNVPLDSSEYLNTSETIPFMGMVLHGFVNFTGMAMNNAGDLNYQILKCIENGAAPFFQLSYENTNKMKTNGDFSKYYSIDFGIWFDDMVTAYKKLNEALRDLQTKLIIDHEFIEAERVLTAAEIAELEEEQRKLDEERAKREAEEKAAKELAEYEAQLREELGLNKKDEEGEEGAEGEAADTKKEETTEPEEEVDETEGLEVIGEEEEKKSRTAVYDGVVRVTYEGGTYFILNYNNFAIKVNGEEIPALGYVRYN